MQVIPTYSNVGQLFSTDNFFYIPKYQRPYSWEDEHLEDFINDIKSCYISSNKTHFLGAIVTIEDKIAGSIKSKYEVIDGQQRLTTIALFAFALIKYYDNIKFYLENSISNYEDLPLYEKIKISIDELTKQYIKLKLINDDKVETILKLEPSNADSDFYRSLLFNVESSPKCNSHTKLQDNFNNLYKFIDELTSFNDFTPLEVNIDLLTDKYNKLKSIVTILNERLFILNVVTKKKSDAYTLFQTLNNRGLNLTVADLLKATTLENLDKYPEYQHLAEISWIDLVDNDDIDDFLNVCHFYETGKYPNKVDLYNSLLSQLFPWEVASENDAKKICNKLKSLLDLYQKYTLITQGTWPYPDDPNNNLISDWEKNRLNILIKNLNHTQCIPLILHASKLDENEFFKYVHLTEKFFFRSKIIYNLHAGSLTKFYTSSCIAFNTIDNYSFKDYKKSIIEFIEDKTPEDKFNESIEINLHYRKSGGNNNLKYLYTMLSDYYDSCRQAYEHPKQFKRLTTDSCNIWDFKKLSIEHISAQNGSDSFDSKHLHKLGNLTLLSKKLNTSLANKPYQEKKDEITKTQFPINLYFNTISNWDTNSFEHRHNEIINLSKIIFDPKK